MQHRDVDTLDQIGTALVGSYDYRLVALSILTAILASYAALDLAARVTDGAWRGPPGLIDGRINLHGPGDLGDALHWDARL